ncbi:MULTISPECIES: CPP1-like family protein [unclassified Coleofasciculus]|uniref:CPP1-like family protein n=1 Tax=unclassified Coleofasciculus TaxID=2692782 RepID=UPI00187EBBCF|nr:MULTISPECIES: CPP1-like family protein [unclassified Coleofasciculus]MBE9128434.1 CPP1-like family protein [Coleofasciculus sp. LEGE 07081]MBE9149409.1 CPP1-like family protein [Coleofasciculus sp. LEGE 07092]
MSDQNPYEKLGVTEDASFDEIQDAKGRLMQQYRGDPKLVETVEAAYDAIIMDRLRMRQEGKIKVPERIRFPERLPQTPLNVSQTPANSPPAWLQRFLDTPTTSDLLWPGVVFLILSGLAVLYSGVSILPLAVALGFGCNIYFLNRKEQQFGRAVLLTLAGLLIGVGLGTALGGVIESQLMGIGLTIEKFATLITFVLLWLISSFLR